MKGNTQVNPPINSKNNEEQIEALNSNNNEEQFESLNSNSDEEQIGALNSNNNNEQIDALDLNNNEKRSWGNMKSITIKTFKVIQNHSENSNLAGLRGSHRSSEPLVKSKDISDDNTHQTKDNGANSSHSNSNSTDNVNIFEAKGDKSTKHINESSAYFKVSILICILKNLLANILNTIITQYYFLDKVRKR